MATQKQEWPELVGKVSSVAGFILLMIVLIFDLWNILVDVLL